MKVERSIELPATPEEVYAVVMDAHRLVDWVTIHQELVDGPERELKKGDELTQKLKVGGQGFKVSWEVVKAEKPSDVEWAGRGPMGTNARVSYGLEDRGGTTCFIYANEYEFPGGPLGKLGAKAFERTAAKEADKSLERLKGLFA
jgi:carbon monoxide dehydrogenase subunit G